MQEEIFEPFQLPAPRTMTVVCMLVGAALIVSYLWAYALTNVLVAAELMSHWQPGRDPRPMRMCVGFVVVMAIITVGAAVAQWSSRRQIQQIDEMERE